jgi:hypothetical protein
VGPWKKFDFGAAWQALAWLGRARHGRVGHGKAWAPMAQIKATEGQTMRTVKIELTGKMPLLMHADNIEWADQMEEWKNDPGNTAKSKAGDDRTPPYRWIGCLNYDDPKTGKVSVPSEYVMRCFMDGAAQVPTGKGRTTFKSQSQSGMVSTEFHWAFRNNGKPIQMAAIQELMRLKTFREHQAKVQALGFQLFMKRVKIGASKHIRVRPRFDEWSASGELTIVDEAITDKVLNNILDISGRLKGLGDWRPSAPKSPGPFGTFSAKLVS